MIDIHCHILPGIDDGALSVEDSVKMARVAASDGIRKVVATPHISDGQCLQETIKEKIHHLNHVLDELGIPVEILPGAEVQYLFDPLKIKACTINNTAYALIEFPFEYLPSTAKEIIFKLIINGLKPIIAHPERNLSIIRNPEMLLHLLDEQVYVQITADSIAGTFGREIEKCATHLLKKGWVDVMASDAHSSGYRCPNLSKGLRRAEKIIGKQNAQRLVKENPEAIISGKNIGRTR